MADLDRVAIRVSDGLRSTLARVNTLALGIAVFTAAIGLATFATGWWVFDGSTAWLVIGGVLCFVPTAAALIAWFLVHCTLRVAPALVGDVRTMLNESRGPAKVLIDYDTGEPLTRTAKSFETLRSSTCATGAQSCRRCTSVFGQSPKFPDWPRSPSSARSPSARSERSC